MTQKSNKHEKFVSLRRNTEIGVGVRSEDVEAPISTDGKSRYDAGSPTIHTLSKKDIENELTQIERKFGMTSEQFYNAWKEGRVHGHEAVKLGSYYEFYKDEYE